MTATRRSGGNSGWVTTFVLFLTGTAVSLAAAMWLDRRGAFTHIDTLFNADAPWYLRGFVDGSGTGTSWGPRSLIHPNVANLVQPLVAMLAQSVDWLGASGDPASVRRFAALAVCPVAAGAETALIYRVLRPRISNAGLVAAVVMLSFSMVLFGATPESFALTGFGLALLFWVLEREQHTGRPQRLLLLVAGAFLVGVTITNVVLFAIALVVHRWMRGEGAPGLTHTGVTVAASVFVTFALAAAIGAGQGRLDDYVPRFEQLHEAPILRRLAGRAQDTKSMTDYSREYSRRAFVEVPQAMAYSFVPPAPEVVRTATATITDAPIALSYRRTMPDWRRIAPVMLAILLGGLAVFTSPRERKPLGAAALALLVFNWGFHTFFGEELLLYSKHWTPAAALLASVIGTGGAFGKVRTLVLSALVLAVGANTLYVLWRIGQPFAEAMPR